MRSSVRRNRRPLHESSAYSFTVAPPDALPSTFGELSFPGDAGDVDVNVGASGGVESSV